MGGEKAIVIPCRLASRGSPPRGRGKVEDVVQAAAHLGITPAWAGKRWAWDALSTSCWDYPRVGGEKALPSNPL